MMLLCLLCSSPLTDKNASSEHIIPNALGGHISTRLATCSKCNSKAGSGIDGELVKAFAKLATMLDVPRARGDHPEARVRDMLSGHDLVLAPGKIPQLAPNVKVGKTEDNLRVEFFAPTKEAAEAFTRNQLGRKGAEFKLQAVAVVDKPKYSFTFAIDTKPPSIQRAIAKVACCYARRAGVRLGVDAIGPRFVRGEESAPSVVGSAAANVVSMPALPANATLHVVSLHRPPGRAELFAHVSLFQAWEFVVLVDEAPTVAPGFMAGYAYDLISGANLETCLDWIGNPGEMLRWIREQPVPLDRQAARAQVSSVHWLSDLPTLYASRLAPRYFALLSGGVSEEVAKAQVANELKLKLQGVGMEIDAVELDIRFSEVPGMNGASRPQ